ncbi:S1 family peptidase [Streptomyces niger]|uniref:S1 family peptidase n=1 Tax=Streptomyces niger TaxID=66373 RepID=UPI0006996D0F|nr:serine protease [Streptomyces niger]
MDITRVMEIWCRSSRDDEQPKAGSGYLVSTDLVLTARHCVNLAEAVVDVRRVARTGTGQWHRAEVLWMAPEGASDIAVLHIRDSGWTRQRLRPVRWGRLAGADEQVPCIAVGFPDAERSSGNVRDTKEIRGVIEPLTGVKSGNLSLHVKDSSLPKELPGGTLWSGISGAALFSGPWLVGVITRAPVARHGVSALTAAPVAGCLAPLRALGLISGLHKVTARAVRRAKIRTPALRAGALVVVATGVSLVIAYTIPPEAPPIHRMSGLPNAGVVSFEGRGDEQDPQVLDDVATSFTRALRRTLKGTEVHGYVSDVRLPLSGLTGSDRRQLDNRTSDFVRRSNAALVISALVNTDTTGQTKVTPAIYVRPDQVPDAPELSGWYAGGDIVMDAGWESSTGRNAVVSQLVARTRGLAEFVTALDLWRNGRGNEAAEKFDRLLRDDDSAGRSLNKQFVGSDLLHLFRGHALEQMALGENAAGWKAALTAARADYEAVPRGSPIHRRARLSLAGNTYLTSVGPAPTCRVKTVQPAGLKTAAASLQRLASDAAFTDIGRLKASVNLAQVKQCLITAGLTPDDGSVDRLTARVRAARHVDGGQPLRALAASVAATHSAAEGELAEAVMTMKEALKDERRFATRALWEGLLASWSYRLCAVADGDGAQRRSISQLEAAVSSGEVPARKLTEYHAVFDDERSAAHARCGAGGGAADRSD